MTDCPGYDRRVRILLLTTRYPWPAWRGNQVRTVQWLEALEHEDVLVLSPGPMTAPPPAAIRTAVWRRGAVSAGWGLLRSLFWGRPLQEGLYSTRAAFHAVRDALDQFQPDLVIVQMVRLAWATELVRSLPDPPAILFDAIDAMGLHFRRAAQSTRSGLSPIWSVEAARAERREHELAEKSALTVAISPRDLKALHVPAETARVVPNFTAIDSKQIACPCSEPLVLLSGNLGYRPTVEGALWFAKAVWPELLTRLPYSRWILAGARPCRAIRRLAALPGVEVYPDPPSLVPFFRRASAAIAPMASGSGVPTKILEAWAHSLPVIAHPWSAAGLLARPGTDLTVTEDPGIWVAELERLLRDPGYAISLGLAGRDALLRTYTRERVIPVIRDACAEAVAKSEGVAHHVSK